MRSIGVVTTSRADFGIYLPLLRKLRSHPDFRLMLYVTGMHLASEFGRTVDWIEAEGIPIHETIPMLVSGDDPETVGKSMGLGLIAFSQSFNKTKPDFLLVLGDRFEMLPPALAALPFLIPVGHIHGGEITYGAMDDALRHCLTKLSHIHFAATQEYGHRIIQMGEEPWRVVVCGAPGLENLDEIQLPSKETIESELQFCLSPAPLLVTFHPTTLDPTPIDEQATELLKALERIDRPIVMTAPNADPGGQRMAAIFGEYLKRHPNCKLVKNLGTRLYFGLMNCSAAMVGNSSSGIIEAPSFRLPVVNIGCRQDGRIRAVNVIDVPNDQESILRGINRALSDDFRRSLATMVNPYDAGRRPSDIIIDRLQSLVIGPTLVQKKFFSLDRQVFSSLVSALSNGEKHHVVAAS